MKFLILILIYPNLSWACASFLFSKQVYQIDSWKDLDKAISKTLELKNYKGLSFKLVTSERESIESHLQVKKPKIFKLIPSNLLSHEYRYIKSIVRGRELDSGQVVSVYSAGKGSRSRHLASFVINKQEVDAYYYNYFNFYDSHSFEVKLSEAIESYDQEFKWRGFKKVFDDYTYLFKFQNVDELRTEKIARGMKQLGSLRNIEINNRILGLSLVDMSKFLIFQGYYLGKIIKDKKIYLRILIEREEKLIALNSIRSLQTTVY